MDTETSKESNPSLNLFGMNLLKIPCFRETYLYSLSSYFGVGIITFLCTSRPTFSSHCGMASFVLVTLGYYTNCRLKYKDDRFKIRQLQESLNMRDTPGEVNPSPKIAENLENA